MNCWWFGACSGNTPPSIPTTTTHHLPKFNKIVKSNMYMRIYMHRKYMHKCIFRPWQQQQQQRKWQQQIVSSIHESAHFFFFVFISYFFKQNENPVARHTIEFLFSVNAYINVFFSFFLALVLILYSGTRRIDYMVFFFYFYI